MALEKAEGGRCPEHQRLERLLTLHEVALGRMSHGLLMVDGAHRVALFNRRFLDMYRLSPDVVHTGMSVRDLLAHSSAVGNFPYITAERAWQRLLERLSAGEPFSVSQTLPDGGMIEAYCEPLEGGGLVCVYKDVTQQRELEGAMQLQVERTQQAIGLMSQGVCMFDADERLVMANDEYFRIYDFDPHVVKPGVSLREIIEHAYARGTRTERSPDETYAERRSIIRRRQPSSWHSRLTDGRVVNVTVRPTSDGGWISYSEDITARLTYENALRQQNLRFDAALNNMSHGLCMFDADQRLIVCNQQYYDLYGLDPRVVKPGVSYREMLDHWTSHGHAPMLSADELYARRMQNLNRRDPVIVEIPMRNGRIIEATIKHTAGGGWVSASEDVTERERAANALSQQNMRFDAALNNMSHGLAMFDAENRLIVCNQNYLTMFDADPTVVKPGATMREILAHGVAAGLYPGVTVDELIERRLAAFAEGKPASYDQSLSDGRTIRLAICPMVNGGWVATYEDVTDARRLENERAAALRNLREQHQRFDAALENMSHGLCMMGADHRLIVCNNRFIEMLGLSPDVMKPGLSLWDLVSHSVEVGNCPGMTAEEVYAGYLARYQPGLHNMQRKMPDGRVLLVTRRSMEGGGWVAIYEDITERERAAAALLEQNRRFDAALNNMSHGLCMLDEESRMIVCNQRYLDLFGFSAEIVKPGISMREIMEYSVALGNHPVSGEEHYRNYIEQLEAGRTSMHRDLTDGRTLLITHRPNPHGGWVLIFEDITERLKSEERISYMARHDALTGLPNRLLFRERMAESLGRVETSGATMAVLCLDLDNFKSVNDTLGHPIGDQLLTTVARRITCILGPDDVFSRLGGDEFAIVQEGHQPSAAMALARRIIEVIGQPIFIDDNEINTGVSIGIAVAPNDGIVGDHLLKCADLALYRAKADGRSRFRLFETDMDTRIGERRALELDLRKALAAGEFILHYQPQMRASNCELTGMEALLRWTHAERGPVSPSEFIPLAEETGLIIPLGEWVLRRACEEAASWPYDIRVAVNLSPVQFKGRSLVGMVTGALAASGLRPDRLELEITEAVLLQDDEATLAMLHQLRALGVRISMDDFGTGYSSLSYLRSFPFDKIKIDRSFIADIDRGRDSTAIIRAIAGMGASLGIDTTAEGVETAEQFERVRRDGCTEIQGYYFSPPRPASEVFRLAGNWRHREVA